MTSLEMVEALFGEYSERLLQAKSSEERAMIMHVIIALQTLESYIVRLTR